MSHTVATTIQLLPSVANPVATTCTATAATTRRITAQTSASSNRHRFTASHRFMLVLVIAATDPGTTPAVSARTL